VSGVSLTVVAVEGSSVQVSLIPHTAAATTLGKLRPGASVNLEADVIARYVDHFLNARGREHSGGGQEAPAAGLTRERLAEHGFQS
jgi:riboflavin synthase